MDTHTHLKITPSGHENQGVHVCRKCGWAFPKLHPSGKQRRAHKRICGTIEGYKLIATVSGDEPSDEDYRTPSPKIDESRSIIVTGGVGERSEDEVFSDAVAEFSDSGISPRSDMGSIEAAKGDTISESDKAVSSLPENYEVGNDNATTNITLIEYNRPQEVAVSASSVNDKSCDFSLVESETAVNAPRYVFNAHGSNDGYKQTMTCIVEKHVTPAKEKVPEFLVDAEEPKKENPNGSPEAESDLQELDSKTSYFVPTNGLVESTQSARVDAEMSVHGYPLLFEPVENIEASVNTLEFRDTKSETSELTHVPLVANDLPIVEHADIALEDFIGHNAPRSDFPYMDRTLDMDDGGTLEDPYTRQSFTPDKTLTEFEYERAVDNVHLSGPSEQIEVFVSTAYMKVDPLQDKDPDLSGDFCEIRDTDRETMHLLTVVSNLPLGDHADIKLKDYKEHHSTFRREFSPDLGSDNVVRPSEGDNEVIVMESKPGSIANSLTDMNYLEEDMIILEGSDKGVADTFKFSATTDNMLDSDGLETLPCTSRIEEDNIQTNCFLQVASHRTSSPMIFSHNDEVSQTTRLNDGNNNQNEMTRAEDIVIEGNVTSEGVPEIEQSTIANANFVHENGSQTTKFAQQNNGGEHVDVTMELSVEAWIEKSTEAAAVEKFTTAITELQPEPESFYSNYSASIPNTSVSGITAVVVNVMPAHPCPRKFLGNDCKEVNTEPEINNESEAVVKCDDGGTVDFKFCHSVDSEVAKDDSKKSVMIIHSEISHGSSGGVKTEHGSESVVSKPMQESDGKLIKQSGGDSDVSVDISSQIGDVTMELSDEAWIEKSTEAATVEKFATAITELQPEPESFYSNYSASIPNTPVSGITAVVVNVMPAHPCPRKFLGNDCKKVNTEPEINNESEAVAKCDEGGTVDFKFCHSVDSEVAKDDSKKSVMIIHSEIPHGSSGGVKTEHGSESVVSKPMQESDGKLIKEPGGDSDVSVDRSSQIGDVTMELSDEAWIEKSTGAAAVEKFATATTTELQREQGSFYSDYYASIPNTPVSGITTVVVNVMPAHPSPRKFLGNDCKEVNTEPEINNESETVAICGDGGTVDFKFCHSVDSEVAKNDPKKSVIIINAKIPHGSSGGVKTEHGSESVVSEPMQESDGKVIEQPGGDSDVSVDIGSQIGDVTMELSDEAWIEKSTEAAAVEKFATATTTELQPEPESFYSNYYFSIPNTPVSGITAVAVNVMTAHPSPRKFLGNDCKEVNTEPEINNESDAVAKCGDGGTVDYKFSHSVDSEVAKDDSKKSVMIIHSEIPHGSSGGVKTENGGKGVISELMQGSDGNLIKQPGGDSDISVDISSQTDSVEGNWGSVSGLSAQSGSFGTEAQLKTDSEGPDKSGSTTLHQNIAFKRQVSGNANVFETHSFMTLVERTGGPDRKADTSEIETVDGTEQPKYEALKSEWLPSLSNVVNQSVGRKKNEEIIAKVTNWSTGQHHNSTPLKNLLGEAKLETRTKSHAETKIQNDETEGINKLRSGVANVKEVMASEAPAAAEQIVKKETADGWNSPARYPVEIRKEKKKAKGKPSWLPFVCCSSANKSVVAHAHKS